LDVNDVTSELTSRNADEFVCSGSAPFCSRDVSDRDYEMHGRTHMLKYHSPLRLPLEW
jgi:hypothetical protein